MLLEWFDPEMIGFAYERKNSLMKLWLCRQRRKMFEHC